MRSVRPRATRPAWCAPNARAVARGAQALTVLLLGLLLAGSLGAGSASAHPRPGKRHHHARSCSGIGRVDADQVWLNRDGDRADELSRLICSAADHSVVLVKMFFIVDDSGAAVRFMHDVELMHRYHHVQFRFLVNDGTHLGALTRKHIKQDERAVPGTRWFGCRHSCESTRANSITHSKFIAISKLATTGRPALFTTSSNISEQQLAKTVQSGVLFSRNTPLYERFVHEFAVYRSCGEHRTCDRELVARPWLHYGAVSVYFAPDAFDPIAADLRHLDCSRGGTIDVVSLWLRSPALVTALRRDHHAGCRVEVIVEHPEDSVSVSREFGARTEQQHDKYLLVRTPKVHMVYAGTQDFGPKALRANDNFMIRTANGRVFDAYEHEFHYQWTHSVSWHSARARAISRAATAAGDR